MNSWIRLQGCPSTVARSITRFLRTTTKSRSATLRNDKAFEFGKTEDMGVLEHVDAVQTHLVSGKRRAKLHQGLEKRDKPKVASVAMQGVLEATAEDVCTILNSALETPAFSRIFKGCKDTSIAFEIDRVKLSPDCSHAVAYWRSHLMDKFISHAIDREGVEMGLQLSRKMNQYVTNKFKHREPAFRSFLMKNMDFRRVPRIAFKHFDEDQ